jgi:DNA-binding Xre family transcriptional regulator
MIPDKEISRRALANLKRMLVEQGISYRKLSEQLELSLVTIKRTMNSEDLSLSRLSQICSVIGVNPGDVISAAALEQRTKARPLTEQEEEFFVTCPPHFGYFRELLRGRSPGVIAKRFGINKKSTDKYLKELASGGFIKVLPGHKIKVLVPFSGSWLPSGPLARLHLGGLYARVTERQRIRATEEMQATVSGAHGEDLRWMRLLWLTFSRYETYETYIRDTRELTRKFLRSAGKEISSDGEETLRPVLLSLFIDSSDEYRDFLPDIFSIKDLV